MNITEFTEQVMDGELDDIIMEAFDILKLRLRHLRDEEIIRNRMKIAIGDTVRLSGLKPKYLNGQTVVIEKILTKTIEGRLNGNLTRIPISCITKV